MHRAARILRGGDAEQAGAEKQVRRRTMRQRRPAFVAAAKLVFAQVHAMRQHRAPSGQAMVIVDVEIVLPFGKQLRGPFDLALVLGDVRVHQHVLVLAPQRARRIELRRRAGAGKARRDGVEAARPCRASARSAPWIRRSRAARYRAALPARCGPSAPCRPRCACRGAQPPRTAHRPIADRPRRTPAPWWCRCAATRRRTLLPSRPRGPGRRTPSRPGTHSGRASRATARRRTRRSRSAHSAHACR